jgi:hypothetical protein
MSCAHRQRERPKIPFALPCESAKLGRPGTTFYAVLETPTGEAYHVPVSAREVDTLRVGDLVSFETRRGPAVRPVDRHIAQVAAGRSGVYALASEQAHGERDRLGARDRLVRRHQDTGDLLG